MKKVCRISLIFLIGSAVFVSGAYANSLFTKWFYPHRIEQEQKTDEDYEEYAGTQESGEAVEAGAADSHTTTCDTKLETISYDTINDTTVKEETAIPAKYIGMDRQALEEAVKSYELSPPLEELNKGLMDVQLVSFSPERVVLRKSYYLPDENRDEFVLVVENNYITVYHSGLEEVYLYTDIRLDELPQDVQNEIIQKKYVESEEELYNFLESYSS